jgi:heterodisulfide reductase subunit A-like polyferredoxin
MVTLETVPTSINGYVVRSLCVVCPTGAISVRHFTREEILAEIDALAGVPA